MKRYYIALTASYCYHNDLQEEYTLLSDLLFNKGHGTHNRTTIPLTDNQSDLIDKLSEKVNSLYSAEIKKFESKSR